MLDLDMVLLIGAIVRRKVEGRERFTAYEVTREVRARGCFLRHADCRAVMHGMFDANMLGSDYDRTLADLGGSNGPALVYHHIEDVPTDPRWPAQILCRN
jgi:hypothetical protein